MSITYRIANNDDIESLYEFALKAIADSVLPAFAEDAGADLESRLSLEITTTLIAVDENADIIAYVELDRRSSHSKSVYIRGVYVLPSHRRMGVGRKLLEMVKSEFSRHGERIMVEAYTKKGRRFWESLNFEIHHYAMELQD